MEKEKSSETEYFWAEANLVGPKGARKRSTIDQHLREKIAGSEREHGVAQSVAD